MVVLLESAESPVDGRRAPAPASKRAPRWVWPVLACWLAGTGFALWMLTPFDPSATPVCTSPPR